jgi:glycosyltransferase involved in cell wall biosynthesis
MRVLMLGWEFPPFIAGGLGTACYGLTKALDRLGQEVIFVLPRAIDRVHTGAGAGGHAAHVKLLSPEPRAAESSSRRVESFGIGSRTVKRNGADFAGQGLPPDFEPGASIEGFEHTVFRSVPASFFSPYPGGMVDAWEGSGRHWMDLLNALAGVGVREPGAAGHAPPVLREAAAIAGALGGTVRESAMPGVVDPSGGRGAGGGPAYDGDMMIAVERYARLVVAMCRNERFDVIHAHDWMTFPAGIALSQVAGRPLVVHVHSTEFDRAGENVNQQVYDIERRGMHASTRVIAVSELTRSICLQRYGVEGSKVEVVYNGIDTEQHQPTSEDTIQPQDKIVLFLGRITMQKGPEYFIRAAKRVLERVKDVKFVVAGSGDMALRMIDEAAHLGIGHKVLFTGFLRGKDVDRVFQMADVYVMPSVSEPFGIAPLEAMRNDVPVIISKQSGVSEVLTHALKVDFWDIDEMANKIVAVLRHEPLGRTLREHGAFEVRKLTWDGAAARCTQIYERAVRIAQGG